MAPERLILIACAAAMLAACANPTPASAPSPVALYPGSAEGDAALLRGRLEMDGPCLYIVREGGERWLAAFPSPGTTWDAAEQSVNIDGRAVRVGADAAFAGGETTGTLPWVRPPARTCDQRRIWRVTTIGP